MTKLRALGAILAGLLLPVTLATTASAACPNCDPDPVYIYNSTTSVAGHHIYAYTGTECNGTRYKLEPGSGKTGIRSYKSPWDSVARTNQGGNYGVPDAYCLSYLGRYDGGTGLNIKVS